MRQRRIIELLILAVCSALLSALWFAGAAIVALVVRGTFAAVSRDFLWMSPLSYLLFFLVLWLPVAALGLALERRRALQMGTLVFVSAAVFAALLPWTEIARLSAGVIALGLGTVAARAIGKYPDAWVLAARRISVALLLVFAVAALAFGVWTTVGRHRATAALADAPAGSPNVLLIILDTIRGDELGTYGYPRPTTPHLDSFASRATLFEAAIAPASWTLPSHGAVFTGRYPGRLTADYLHPLDGTEPTLAEVMRTQGYETAGFVANLNYTAWDSGLERGFIRYSDYERSFEQVLKSSNPGRMMLVDELLRADDRWARKRALRHPKLYVHLWGGRAERTAESITSEFLEWTAKGSADHPWFAFLNYFDAHDPYDPMPEFRKRFVRDWRNPDARDLYDAELAYLDEQLGRLFQEMERRGDFRNTLVIVTSDHGEHFGERRLWVHGNSLYYALLHVPLMVRFDGRVPAGMRIPAAVSLRDIGATVLDLAGLGERASFPGQSLAGHWRGGGGPTSPPIAEFRRQRVKDPTLPLEDGTMLAILDDEWHLIRSQRTQITELFRYREDPREERNLVGSTEGMEAVARLRAQMEDALVRDAPDTAFAGAKARERADSSTPR